MVIVVDPRTINVLSFCTGTGMLDAGLALALGGTARTICYVEREAFCAALLAARMEEQAVDAAPLWSDVHTFDGKPWRGVVDFITGGYPCQPFSFAGQRRGEDDPRHLWPSIARVIGEVEPFGCWFENVGGHLSLGFEQVRADLQGLGYRVAAGLFTAEEVGAPHKRERLFILALADPTHDHGRGGERGAQAGVGTRGVGRGRSASGGAELVYPEHDGGRANLAGAGTQRRVVDRGAGGGGYGPFPPGPGDLITWRRILADRPELAPAVEPRVRGVADGNAARLDRLRACGNGVVPLCAAYAFVSLWASLQGDQT